MTNDELEFLISQHLDGTLDAADTARLSRVVEADAAARTLLDGHRRLDDVLRASRVDAGVDGDWLAAQVAARLDERPAPSLRMSRWMWAGPVAMAAVLMVGLTLGVLFLRDEGTAERPAEVARLKLDGPAIDAPTPGPGGYASVSVGVPANLTPAIVQALYLSDASMVGRVTIRPAGHAAAGALE